MLRRVPIVNGSARLANGNSFFAPYTTLNGTSTQDPLVYICTDGVVSVMKGSIEIPENFVGSPQLKIVWTSETAAGDVDFKFRHRTTDGNDTELLDISTAPAEIEDTIDGVTGPTAPSNRMVTTITLAATDMVVGATLYYEFERDGLTDTKADKISIWEDGPHFEYQDV